MDHNLVIATNVLVNHGPGTRPQAGFFLTQVPGSSSVRSVTGPAGPILTTIPPTVAGGDVDNQTYALLPNIRFTFVPPVPAQGSVLHPPANLVVSGTGETATLNWSYGKSVLYENFESGNLPFGWLNIDEDGDGYAWVVIPEAGKEGDGFIRSESLSIVDTPLTPENWLISPEFYVTVFGTHLNYWVAPLESANNHEKFQVFYSSPASDDINDFIPFGDPINLTGSGWVRMSQNLSHLVDNDIPIRIAFVHQTTTGSNRSGIKLDGISVVELTANMSGYEHPVAGFNIYRNGTLFSQTNASTLTANVGLIGDFNELWVSARYLVEETIVESSPGNVVYRSLSEIENELTPQKNSLFTNYPNPFNPLTVIGFRVQGSGDSQNLTSLSFGEGQGEGIRQQKVKIDIFNIKGQKVRSLVDDSFSTGEHSVVWNGTDDNGLSVGSGVYFYQMKMDGFVETRKMVLMK